MAAHRPWRLAALFAACALFAASAGSLPARGQGSPAPGPGDEALLPARLVERAVLQADTFLAPPPDALADLTVSGKHAAPGGARVEEAGSRPMENRLSARSGAPGGRLALPFAGQPVQGFSGLVADGTGAFLALSDNGFGNKANSPDAMLMVHRLQIDWATGAVERLGTVFLNDRDRRLPFPIVTEGTQARYLTGADLDPESLQKVGDSLWIGDEFGPFLVETDLSGRVKAVFSADIAGRPVRAPLSPAPDGGEEPALRTGRSKGFEGLALTRASARLLALLEGPLGDPVTGRSEEVAGAPALRILEFDLARRAFTGRTWTYGLAAAGHAIGDFIMLDDTRGLVIERDDGQGRLAQACGATGPGPCFPRPARYKRVVVVALPEAGRGEAMTRLGAIDLLSIADPAGLGDDARGPEGPGGPEGPERRFALPFVTIESLLALGPGRILVGNDNNLPFSAGRAPQVADDSEFVVLDVPALRQPAR